MKGTALPLLCCTANAARVNSADCCGKQASHDRKVPTIKHANTMPCGRCSPLELRAGVHRNTKVYMLPSKRLCIIPKSAIF